MERMLCCTKTGSMLQSLAIRLRGKESYFPSLYEQGHPSDPISMECRRAADLERHSRLAG